MFLVLLIRFRTGASLWIQVWPLKPDLSTPTSCCWGGGTSSWLLVALDGGLFPRCLCLSVTPVPSLVPCNSRRGLLFLLLGPALTGVLDRMSWIRVPSDASCPEALNGWKHTSTLLVGTEVTTRDTFSKFLWIFQVNWPLSVQKINHSHKCLWNNKALKFPACPWLCSKITSFYFSIKSTLHDRRPFHVCLDSLWFK